MALWHVRLSRTKNLEFDRYCEDLAEHYSIVKIGYDLSKDVRGFSYADLRIQIEKDNPIPKGWKLSNYACRIDQYLSFVRQFMEFEKGDYIISPYYISPNSGKVSIGHVTGDVEILRNLLGSNLNQFAQKYTNTPYILTATENLAIKVKWDTKLFKKDLLNNKIQEKIKNRRTIIPLDFSAQSPQALVKNPNSITWIP